MQPTPDYPLDYTKGPMSSGQPAAGLDVSQFAKHAEALINQAKEYGAQAQHAVQNFKPFLQKSAKEQPITTLAALAAVGFILGALWKK